ncbi:hypothetical protein [Maribacter sp. 2307UL18-2]|uniref:hypothetical protein n=1 Tax=Maribacter sp. 2307UL18-2 TaxID=3386274 RepID=UPI0039BC64C1
MPKYCVNKETDNNGDHEVHKENCPWWPSDKNRLDLGYHDSCESAVAEAKKHYSNVNGHKHCSQDCHTS